MGTQDTGRRQKQHMGTQDTGRRQKQNTTHNFIATRTPPKTGVNPAAGEGQDYFSL